MNIIGLLVQAHPEWVPAVRARIGELPGAEVHAVTPAGRLVVTLEHAGEGDLGAAFDQLAAIPGVCGTALVYHHCEATADDFPSEKESKT